jgi:hypothetical protein
MTLMISRQISGRHQDLARRISLWTAVYINHQAELDDFDVNCGLMRLDALTS